MSQTLNLKIFRNDELVEEKTVTQDVVKIGKLKSSHLCLEDDTVARMHAVIEVSGSDVRVIDLGSATGTLLNSQRVEKNAVLKDGDALAFGPYRVEINFAEAEAAPAAYLQPAAVAVAPVAAAPIAAAAAVAAAPAAQVVQRPVMHVDAAEVERQDGTTVTEVVAMYGRSVLDVQHVGQVKPRSNTAPVFIGLGIVMMALGGYAFANDVFGQDWEAYHKKTQEFATAGKPPPPTPGSIISALGGGFAFLGLVPFCIGLVRLEDKGIPSYTIGEGHHATFQVPTAGLPDATAFALVRGGAHGQATLNFTAEMDGDVTLDGQKLPLSELVSSGRAAAMGSTFSFPLPAGAHCRVTHGGVAFHVNSVAAGRVIATKGEADKPFWLFTAASLVLLGSLLVLAHLAMPDEGDMSLDDDTGDNRFVGYMNQPDEEPEPEPPPEEENSDEEAGGEGKRHKGEEGKMGKPTAKKKSGLYAMKGPKDAVPQMARNFDPDMMARNAGILGMVASDSGHFLASPYGEAFAQGNDDQDVWGGLTGTEVGEAFGAGGLGLVGTGRGGGGTGEGTIGLGGVGLIGKGGGGGSGSGYGRGSGSGFGGRGKRVPRVRSAKAKVKGALDKDIIRRIVRSHINEVRHCYNQGLVRDPNLKGRVSVQFTIGATGKVPVAIVAQSSLKDKSVANCVAKAVRRWKFPKPRGGGSVMVTYPFVLSSG